MLTTLVVSTLVTAMLFLLAFPQAPAVRALHRSLVEAPVRFLGEMTWRRARTYALVLPVIVVLLLLGPELMTVIILTGGDAAAIELLLVVWALSVSGAVASLHRQTARLASSVLRIIRKPARVRGQMRARRARRKTSQKGRKDDGPAPDWAFA
ncbi:MAG: hypothetical protein QM773_18240 [Hyphomonadaceae bacterium]